MGRKSRYETHIQPHLSEIRDLYGTATEAQIAKRFGVSVASFENYKNEHEELRKALSDGKAVLVMELKETLKKKAAGFHYKETKKIIRTVAGVRTQVVEEYERYSPPDTGAIHLLLKNLDDDWRNDDKVTIELKQKKIELEQQKAEDDW